MNNKYIVTVGGCQYTIVAEDSEEYVQKVAAYVNGKVTEITSANFISSLEASVLAAMNISDERFKLTEQNESLKAQLRIYIEEAAKTKAELSELKRELSVLKRKA